MVEKIAFLCPVAQVFNPKVVQHTIAMVAYASARGYEVQQVGVVERMLIHQARNVLAEGFMRTECDWAFWMDSDMLMPADTIVKLVEQAKKLDTKFMTGVYYQRLGEHLPVLWRKNPILMDGTPAPLLGEKNDPKDAHLHHFIIPTGQLPLKADVCGFGCVLTHRSMFEAIPKPWFKTIADECSEDFYFCEKAKAAGFQLWADPSIPLGHEGQAPFITKADMRLPAERIKEIQV
jgi:hypothetical protein